MQPGTRLAHYVVGAKIGAGGMGEVYRAQDTVLGREVALKVLPPEFAADADRVTLFEREARTLASLHHPNIASIFGFEQTPDCTFLVMELIEGEDLAQVLARGALPVDEAVAIARQIAEGIEEAHEKGIIHRDLKPANVKRTPDGRVKVLDFGLARAFAGQTAVEAQLGSAPTMTAGLTQAGVVLGTAAYMSPEQARGREVDRRTDIWAFGVILFEMLTGKQLFAGETASDTLAGILKTEPDWSTLPASLPHQVERVLRRCLTKDPRQRLRDIGEARVRLENPLAESGVLTGAIHLPAGSHGRAPSRWRALLPGGLAGLAVAVVAWFSLGAGDRGGAAPGVLHLAMPAPKGADFQLHGSRPGLPTFSHDGRRIVFACKDEPTGKARLYVRDLATGDAVALDGTEGAQYPFWSPDDQWIGFFEEKEGRRKIAAGGGPAEPLCPAPNGKGGSWNEAGEIIFSPDYSAPLYRVAALGGTPSPLTTLDGDEEFDSHRHPQFLPGGQRFLYLAKGAGGRNSELRVGSLDGKTARVVMKVALSAQYVSGYLLFLSDQTLMAQPFDPAKGELSGVPTPLASDVMVIPGAAKAAFAASDRGDLVYLRGMPVSDASLVWLDRSGAELGRVGDLAWYESVVLSPDGRLAAVTVRDRQGGTADIWIVEIERNFRTRLTNDPAEDRYPVWMPDGRSLLFTSDRAGKQDVYRQDLGGSGRADLVFEQPEAVRLWDCAPDGRTILFSKVEEGADLNLWVADLAGQSAPRPLRQMKGEEGAARFSADGRWISFWSVESGTGQIYVAPWPAMSPVTQVSTTSGTWSYWSADGRELVCQEGAGRLNAVPLAPVGDEPRPGSQTKLFDHLGTLLDGPQLSLTADGQRFLAVSVAETDPPAWCDVVLNSMERLPPR